MNNWRTLGASCRLPGSGRSASCTRRRFTAAALAGIAASASAAGAASLPLLPSVRWGKHHLTRLLVGHNPIKGVSHQSAAMNRQMREFFADPARGVDLLRRCEAVGINACQMGGRPSWQPTQNLSNTGCTSRLKLNGRTGPRHGSIFEGARRLA